MDDAGRGLALRDESVPALGCRGHQHHARGRAHAAQRQPVDRSRQASPGELRGIIRRIERGLLDSDVLPVDVQLVSDDHGKHRLHALPDLGVLGDDCHDAVRGDADERVRREVRRGRRPPISRPAEPREIGGEQHPAAHDRGDAEELATADACRGVHDQTPPRFGSPVARPRPTGTASLGVISAARWIAWRIRR